MATPITLESENDMAHAILTKIIIQRQIEYYMLQHWKAKTDEDKDKYANLVIEWDKKLGGDNE